MGQTPTRPRRRKPATGTRELSTARDDRRRRDRFGEPMKTATVYDVARSARVSTATVSRVVHGADLVRASTRDRVNEVIEQLGYVPDGAAQSLSRRRKEVIGLVSVERTSDQFDVENMSLLFYDEILHGVEARLHDEEWSLLIKFLSPAQDDSFRRIQSLSGKVDGLLIGEGIVESQRLAQLATRVPVMVIAGARDEHGVDVVAADNRSGSAALVTHLVAEHGRTRLFHVDGPTNAPDAAERRYALERVVRSHPEARVVGSYQGNFKVQSGDEAGRMLLAQRQATSPDAVVCANDQMAIGVMQVLEAGGVHVPEEIAVVGFDDIFPGNLSDPSLTTVHQPMRLLGERACVRLLERIADPGLPPRLEVLPTELVLRASCGCPPESWRRVPVRPVIFSRSRRKSSRDDVSPESKRGGTDATADGRRRGMRSKTAAVERRANRPSPRSTNSA